MIITTGGEYGEQFDGDVKEPMKMVGCGVPGFIPHLTFAVIFDLGGRGRISIEKISPTLIAVICCKKGEWQ